MLALKKLCFFTSLSLIVAGLLPSQLFAASSIGSVTLVHGYAYGAQSGSERKSLFTRDDVHQKEVVETIVDGALHLEFVDETTLRLGSDSSMILDTLVYDPDAENGQMVINMVQGAFRFVSGKINKKGVRVQTPTLSIAIRGTDFTVVVAENGDTSVSVDEGAIDVTANNGGGDAVSVSVGQIAAVSTTATSVSVSTGTSVSNDPGLSENGSDGEGENEGGESGGGEGGGGGGSH
jgi:hypothetical protein